MEPLLGVEDVAKILNLSVSTIYNWIFHERIPYLKIGGAVKFDRKRIEEWVRSLSHEPAPKVYTEKKRGRRKSMGAVTNIDRIVEMSKKEVLEGR